MRAERLPASHPRTRSVLVAIGFAACLGAAGCGHEPTTTDESTNRPLPLVLKPDVPEDFLTAFPGNHEVWTAGERLVVRGRYGAAARQHLEFAALDHFLDTNPPELPIYVRWSGASSTDLEVVDVEVDLSAVTRLHNARFQPGSPWSLRFVTQTGNDNWTCRVVHVPTPKPQEICGTGVEDGLWEANSVVRWLDGTSVPDAAKVDVVFQELHAIRASLPGQPYLLYTMRYFAPGESGALSVRFAPAEARSVRLGTYTSWERAGDVDWVSTLDRTTEYFQIYISGDSPRCARVAAFVALPGVVSVEASTFAGRTRLFPRQAAGGRTYLFRRAAGPNGGDCGTCTADHYWYFAPQQTEHRLVGEWDAAPGTEPPAWWAEAQQNLDLFEGWSADCHRGAP